MIEIPNEIKNSLKTIGLGNVEQQVYILLLRKGLLGIQKITEHTKLPRSSVHLACEALLSRGVISVTISGKRRNFYVENPRSIENFILFEENKIKSKKNSLSLILPKLVTMSAISQEFDPIEVQELKGEEGFVKTFYASLNQPKYSEVLRFGGDPTTFNIKKEELKKYREERIKKRIFSRMIQPMSDISQNEIKDAKLKMRDVRILNKEIYNPNITMSIWADSLAVTVWDKGLHSVIIQNRPLSDFMKQIFEIVWSKAEK